MNILSKAFWCLIAVLSVAGPSMAQPATPTEEMPAGYFAPSISHPRKIVMSLSEADPARIVEVIGNTGNIQKFYGSDNVRIELVVYGPGIHAVLKADSKVADRIRSLIAIGIDVRACNATLTTIHKTAADLIEGVKIVPNGIPEIVERQAQGWIYVRP